MAHQSPNGVPDAAEFGQLRAYLAQQGMSQSDINEAIGSSTSGRSRAEIATELRAWFVDKQGAQ